MQMCSCPAATALTTIPAAPCAESFGQIQKVAFCRLRKADGTLNSFVTGASTGIDKLAAWTAKMAKTDGEKVVISPYIQAPTQEAGAPRTFGGGNETLGGIEIIIHLLEELILEGSHLGEQRLLFGRKLAASALQGVFQIIFGGIKALQACLCTADGITIDILPSMYPQGAEKQLIQAVTGRQVPSGGLPAAVGCAVFNAATCKAIHDAVYEGMPLIRRVVTVTGNIVMEPKNLLVPIGTSFNDLMEAVGTSQNPYKVLSGGPMMGVTQYDLSVPTTKGTNAVTILGHKGRYQVERPQCIRCGKCIDVCPMKLMPILMYKALITGDVEQMKAVHMMDCIECGCCAYPCPACVPLVLGFRSGKQRIRDAAAAAASKK